MTRGDVRLDYTFWGWFFARFSILTVFFAAPRRKPIKVLKKHESRTAHRCDRCAALIMIPEAAACPDCGADVPLDRAVCPECGATRESWTCPICSKTIPAYLETCPFCGDVAGREA
jgi:Double zinc ribbon